MASEPLNPLRVLVVEDSEDDAWLLIRELRRGGYHVTYERVETAAALNAALDRQAWDLIISDYSLPGFSGAEALKLYQARDLEIPFIVVSGTIGEEAAVAMMRAGANDYLLKDNLARLLPAVGRELREAEARRERKRAAAALQASERRFKELADLLPQVVFEADCEGQLTFVNHWASELFGYTEADLVFPFSIFQVLVPADRARGQGDFKAVLEHGRASEHEYTVLHKDGHLIPVLVSAAPIQRDGETVGIRGVVVDMTARKQTEEALRRHTAQLEAVRQVGLEIVAQTRLETLLHSIVVRAVELLNGTSGALFLYRPAWDCLECVVAVNLRSDFVGMRIQRGEGVSGRVWQSGQPMVIQDYDAWEGRSAQIKAGEITSLASAPISWGQEFLGVLDVFSPVVGVYTAEDASLLALLTTQAAIALRNARALAAEEQQRQRAEALAQATAALTTTLELESLLENLLTAAIQVIPAAEKGAVLLPTDAQDQLCVRVAVGYTHPAIRGLCFPLTHGYASLAFRSRQPVLVARVQDFAWLDHGVVDETQALQSAMAAPLCYRDRAIGVITLDNASLEGAFSADDLALLKAFADQAAVAVENARLFEEARTERDRLAALYEVSRRLASAYTREVVTRQLAGVVPYVRAEFCTLLLFQERNTPFVYSTFPGRQQMTVEQTHHYVRQVTERGLQAWVLAQRRSALVRDTLLDERWFTLPENRAREPIRSVICVPLLDRQGNVVGTLSYEHSQPERFGPADLQLAEEIGVRVAVALENVRLFEETRRRLTREQQLNELAHTLGGEIELQPLLQRFLPALVGLTEADGARVDMVQPDGQTLVLLHSQGVATLLGEAPEPVGVGVTNLVCRQRAPALVSDYRQFSEAWAPWVEAGLRSVLAVPLLGGQELLGVLSLFRWHEVRPFDAEAVVTAQAAARLAAVALQRARLFEQERAERQLSEALAEAAAAMNRSLNPDEILDQILDQMVHVVPGEAFNLMLMTSTTTAHLVRWRDPAWPVERALVEVLNVAVERFPCFIHMIEQRKPLLIADATVDPLGTPGPFGPCPRSYLGAPILVRGIVVGFLNVSSLQPYRFSSADARRLEAFASQVSTALTNANLFSQLEQAHQRLQQLYRELQAHAGRLNEEVQQQTAQIKAQMAQLEAILHSTADGILVTDAEGHIVLPPNPVAEQWLSRLKPADADRLRQQVADLARRAAEHPKVVLELEGLDLQLGAAPIATVADSPARVVVVAHDISQLKALDRMKSQFVSNVSHELRTPITIIKLYTYMMRRRPEKWREYLAPLEKEADRQAQLVGDVLQISQIDAGRLQIRPRPVPVDDLGQAVVSSHEALASSSELTLEYRPAGPTLEVFVDPDKIKLVLNNLVENAIRYTPAGGHVVIRVAQAEAQGRVWVTIAVQDTGMGIPAEELPLIFDRFYRGEQPRQLQLPGTGLGLAIVKEVTELHGGWVTVESQVGVGSTFTVWLPAVEPAGQESQAGPG